MQGRLLWIEQRARRAFQAATPSSTWLGLAELEQLAARYPVRDHGYHHDPESLLARGRERAQFLLGLDPRARGRFLEVGTSDGMTALALKNAGQTAEGVDIVDELDPRARAGGVELHVMDATHIDLPMASFDVVYSFNAFEHLPDPGETLRGIGRVLKPGGLCYIFTGGLPWSPHGAHLYDAIGVPYASQLFDDATITNYITQHGLRAQRPWFNTWSVEQYRAAFTAQRDVFDTLKYRELYNRYGVDLIAEFPEQFRRAPSFDSLVISAFEILYRRK